MIEDRLKKNQQIYFSTAIIASFAIYINGFDEKKQKILVVDRAKEKLEKLSQKLQKDAKEIKNEKEMFGEVVRDERFVETFKEIYEKIQNFGSEKTLKWLNEKNYQ